VFTLHYATLKGYMGFSGVVAGSVYTILAILNSTFANGNAGMHGIPGHHPS
jgi:hypothetical protein